MNNSIVFHKFYFDALEALEKSGLSAEEVLKTYKAIFEYAFDGKEPEGLPYLAEAVFILIKLNIDIERGK